MSESKTSKVDQQLAAYEKHMLDKLPTVDELKKKQELSPTEIDAEQRFINIRSRSVRIKDFNGSVIEIDNRDDVNYLMRAKKTDATTAASIKVDRDELEFE